MLISINKECSISIIDHMIDLRIAEIHDQWCLVIISFSHLQSSDQVVHDGKGDLVYKGFWVLSSCMAYQPL